MNVKHVCLLHRADEKKQKVRYDIVVFVVYSIRVQTEWNGASPENK